MVLSMTAALAAGTNSITVQNAVNGEKYKAYKMLDLSVSGLDTQATTDDSYRYTINSNWSGFWTTGAGADYITTNTSGTETYVVWKDDMKTAQKMEDFGKAAAAYAAANSIVPEGAEVTAASGTAGWTGLDNGYYLVTSTLGIAASVASTPANSNNVISEKNSGNTTDKEVQEAAERNGTAASWGNANDAQIGDTVYFRAKVSIAKNSINVVYHDKMGQELDWTGVDNVKVYTSTEFTQANELAPANYTVAAGTAPETFTVTFTNDYVAGLTDATTDVWVSYSAVLNDKAVVGTSVPNDGKVTWGENGTTNWDHTDTDTHKFQILKYDGADANHNPLAGAKFQLFTKNTDTENPALTLCVNAAGTIYRVVDTSDSGTTLPDGYTLVSDNKIVTLASSNITVEGVDSDDYYLKETDAPTGFNPIDGYIKVEVNANNELIKEVENNSGNTLPSTGGIGTTLFYVGGGILVLLAVVMLVTKKRMKAED